MPSLRSALALLLVSGGLSGCIKTPPPSERALVENERCAQEVSQGNCKQAEVHCDLGLEFAPQYADLWTNKGLVALCGEDKRQAKDYFIKAIRFNQDQASAHLNLGKLYMDEGGFGKAHDSFQRALKVNPDYLEARYNLALCFLNLKQYEKAEKAFLTLIAVNPNLAQAYHDIGITYYQMDEHNKAVEYMTQAVRLAPGQDPEWWNDLGTVLNELSRYEEARQAFASCVALRPDHPQCLNNLSIAQRKAALTNSALKEYRDTQQAVNTPASHFELARKYKSQGLLKDEERSYKECLKLDGHYAPCHYGLFQLFSDAQNRPSAEIACKNFLKYASQDDFPAEIQTCEKFVSAQSY